MKKVQRKEEKIMNMKRLKDESERKVGKSNMQGVGREGVGEEKKIDR